MRAYTSRCFALRRSLAAKMGQKWFLRSTIGDSLKYEVRPHDSCKICHMRGWRLEPFDARERSEFLSPML